MPTLLGDVLVCPVVAARNATEHGVTLEDEVALLVVHGLLHLLGMDHGEDEEAETMERRERELLARFHRKLDVVAPCRRFATEHFGTTDFILVVVVLVTARRVGPVGAGRDGVLACQRKGAGARRRSDTRRWVDCV